MIIIRPTRASRRALIAIAAFALTIAGTGIGPSEAADACAGTICVERAWARATPPGAQNAAVYFSIVNNGESDDTVSSISTSAAQQAMVHQTTISGGVARMDMVRELRVPAHDRVALTPRSYHVMLTGLKAPLKQGTAVTLKLVFSSGRSLETDVPVLGIAALGPASAPQPESGESAHAHH